MSSCKPVGTENFTHGSADVFTGHWFNMLEANGLTCGSLKQYRGQTATMTPTKGTKHMNDMGPTYDRLQNSPYFCVFKYARAVKQKVWNEAENRERDWGETLGTNSLYGKRTVGFFSLASNALRACEARALRARKTLTPRFTDFFTDFEKKTDCFAVYTYE